MAFFSDEMAGMLETYQAEATDMMGIFDRLVLAGTQKNSFTPEQINEIFRTAHTIKSSSAMMGLDSLSKLTHTMEDLFGVFRDNPASIDGKVDSITDLLYDYSDYVKDELDRMQDEDYLPADATVLQAKLTAARAKFKPAPAAADGVKAAETAAAAAPVQGQTELVVHYAPDCAMVNVRSLVLLKQVGRKWQVLHSEPQNLQDAGAVETIKTAGFKLTVPDRDAAAVKEYLSRNPYTEKVEQSAAGVEAAPKKAEAGAAVPAAAPTAAAVQVAAPAVTAAAPVQAQPLRKVPAAKPKDLSPKEHKEDKFISMRWQDVRRLQDLSGEFISLYANFEQLREQLPYAKELRSFGMAYERLIDDLLRRVGEMSMLTVASLTPQLNRMVREIGRDEGKQVSFEVQGENIEIDRDLYDNISQPLLHILRNSMDHGIELPEEREKAGKPARGKVTLTVENQGARIVFRVSDDGRGMDPQVLLAVAAKKGLLVKPAAEYTRTEAINLIMQPGFTTTAKANAYSGRGVGMDVVRSTVDAFGGELTIDSEPGKGTSISLYMPVSVTAVASLAVKVGSWSCYVPLYSLDKIYGIEEAAALITTSPEGRQQLAFGKKQVPVLDARALLGAPQGMGKYVLVGHSLEKGFALVVDDITGQETAVNKPLPACLDKKWQEQTGIMNAVMQSGGRIGFSLSAVQLLNLCTDKKGGAA